MNYNLILYYLQVVLAEWPYLIMLSLPFIDRHKKYKSSDKKYNNIDAIIRIQVYGKMGSKKYHLYNTNTRKYIKI